MIKNTIFIALIVFLLSGCSRMIPVKPEYQSVNPPDRIAGDLSGEIQLINNQNKNAEEYFSDFSIHKLTGNMHEWTEQAVELTKREIEKRGGTVKDDSEKKIYLSFNASGVEIGTFVYACKGELSLETSKGYQNVYSVKNSSPGSVDRACGGAITLSVIEMLNDPQFREFMVE